MPEFGELEKTRKYSDEQIEKIRRQLSKRITKDCLAIITVGSYARREASPQSDIDRIFITNNCDHPPTEERKIFDEVIDDLGIKGPSATGAFNDALDKSSMVKNIGGNADTTQNLTQRILYLLEGEWLYNEEFFDSLFDEFINKYVRDTITEHQLCRFLLNDLIRYYRTICVDFEYKTSEDGKPWGERNIKLLFSRKLIYFSGILVIAETAQHHWRIKREILKKYLRLTPTERIKMICGQKSEKALTMYNEFTRQMSLPEVRELLSKTPEDRPKHDDKFRKMKNDGHHFTWELSRLLSETYDSSHPIHNAIKF